jgi:hypothetical protein
MVLAVVGTNVCRAQAAVRPPVMGDAQTAIINVNVNSAGSEAGMQQPAALTQVPANRTDPVEAAATDRNEGWALVAAGVVFLAPAAVWHHVAVSDENGSPETDAILADAWLGASAWAGLCAGYLLYRGYQDSEGPSVQVSAAPAPGGGALSLSGTF